MASFLEMHRILFNLTPHKLVTESAVKKIYQAAVLFFWAGLCMDGVGIIMSLAHGDIKGLIYFVPAILYLCAILFVVRFILEFVLMVIRVYENDQVRMIED